MSEEIKINYTSGIVMWRINGFIYVWLYTPVAHAETELVDEN